MRAFVAIVAQLDPPTVESDQLLVVATRLRQRFENLERSLLGLRAIEQRHQRRMRRRVRGVALDGVAEGGERAVGIAERAETQRPQRRQEVGLRAGIAGQLGLARQYLGELVVLAELDEDPLQRSQHRLLVARQ